MNSPALALLFLGTLGRALATGTGTGARTYDFMDGNKPVSQRSRNSLSAPVDVFGASLEPMASQQPYCGERFVASGSVQVCDSTPKRALHLLQAFQTEDGLGLLQHLLSSYSSLLFPTSGLEGFLDLEQLVPTWEGANWTYHAEFLRRSDAERFNDFLSHNLSPYLVDETQALCSVINTGVVSLRDDAAESHSVSGVIKTCGQSPEAAAQRIYKYLRDSYPSLVQPRSAVQLLRDSQARTTDCAGEDECCCSSLLRMEFTAVFTSRQDSGAFQTLLDTKTKDGLWQQTDGNGSCSTTSSLDAHAVRQFHAAHADLLICMPGYSIGDFISFVHDRNPMGMEEHIPDYIKAVYPSILGTFSFKSFVNTDNLGPLGTRACADEAQAFCCDQPMMWRSLLTFGDKFDADAFTHYMTSDLSAHLTAVAPKFTLRPSFVLPVRKGVISWEQSCGVSAEEAIVFQSLEEHTLQMQRSMGVGRGAVISEDQYILGDAHRKDIEMRR